MRIVRPRVGPPAGGHRWHPNALPASLWAGGSVVVLLAAVLRGWSDTDVPGMLLIAGLAMITAVGLLLVPELSPPAEHALLAAGTVAVSTLLVFGHGGVATVSLAMLYTNIGLYGGTRMSARGIAVHQVLMVAGFVAGSLLAGVRGALAPEACVLIEAVLVPTIVIRILVTRATRLAEYDPETGALTRQGLERVLARPLADGAPPLLVTKIEIAGYADVRGVLGRAAAEQLVRRCVERLAAQPGVQVARLATERLIVAGVLDPLDGRPEREVALEQAGRLLDLLEPPAAVRSEAALVDGGAADGDRFAGDLTVPVEPRAGVVVAPADGRNLAVLIARAERALAAAVDGGIRLNRWTSGTSVVGPRALRLQAELRSAISDGQLRLHYQPLFAAREQRAVGVEALVRWQHPVHGLLGPGDFLPLAERSTAIEALTEWVLVEAVRQCATWRAEGRSLPVSVNLSAVLLADPGLPGRVDAVLADHKLPAHLLTLEVTESAVMTRPVLARRMLQQLHERGVRLSLDDFGTGNTSLTLLKELRFDELKIDRSFVSGLLSSPADGAIVRSTLELGHRLGMDVLAEGIEDAEVVGVLTALGCDLLQGFHLARPMPAADLERLLPATPQQPAEPALDDAVPPAPVPADEEQRLAAVRRLADPDGDSDPVLEDAVTLAASVCQVPTALISLVAADEVLFQAKVGVDEDSVPRDQAFCSYALLDDGVLEVEDAYADPRFRNMAIVDGGAGVRFYAGAPVQSRDGESIGTVCVLDTQPRRLSQAQRAALVALSRAVAGQLEARRSTRVLARLTQTLELLAGLSRQEETRLACRTVVEVTRELLGADSVGLVLAEAPGSVHYRAVDTGGRTPLEERLLDLRVDGRGPTAFSQVLRSGEPLFVPDSGAGDALVPGVIAQLGIGAFLLVPVPGPTGCLGALAVGWTRPIADLDATDRHAAQMLAAEAGATLGRLAAVSALSSAAGTDQLTGLLNRRAFLSRLGRAVPGSSVAVLDLDGFREVNDTRGQAEGDRLLRAFADQLREALLDDDDAGRWDGQRFVLVLERADPSAAAQRIEALRDRWQAGASGVGFSAGIAGLGESETAVQVLDRAEDALRTAKSSGGDCCRLATPVLPYPRPTGEAVLAEPA